MLQEEILALKKELVISKNDSALRNAEMVMSVVSERDCIDGSLADGNCVGDRFPSQLKRVGSATLPRAPPGKSLLPISS